MALWLEQMQADVTGFSLPPESSPNLFQLLSPWRGVRSVFGDVCDGAALRKAVADSQPDIVIHMAAQALVRRLYAQPAETIFTNVIGTVNLLEALRGAKNLSVALVITSDKVYRNIDGGDAFAEGAPLGGDDPYSASKAAQEIITQSWAQSFFSGGDAIVASARAGNVLGGGDFAEDRLVPDIYRAIAANNPVRLRNPNATRPWQHVLDLNMGYLAFIERLAKDGRNFPQTLNFGPNAETPYTVGAITEKMMIALGGCVPVQVQQSHLKEKTLLSVDATQALEHLGWATKLSTDDVIQLTADWYGAFLKGADARKLTLAQLEDYTSK